MRHGLLWAQALMLFASPTRREALEPCFRQRLFRLIDEELVDF